MKNNWWLTSRTTKNMTSKHKNCTIVPLILRERDADKTRSGRWNSKFWVNLWRTSDGSHPEPQKTRLRNIKIAPFFPLSSEKEMIRKRVFSQRKRRKWPLYLGRRNSKFWGYLWRTSDGSHPEPHKTRHRNIKIATFCILSSEKEMLIKLVFSQRKLRNWPLFSGRWNSKFWGYLWRTSDGSHS
jgi:hypothetical protein